MATPSAYVQADLDQPILFRTTSRTVFENTLSSGELWLRSDHYYRNIEDKARQDHLEGISSGTTALQLNFPQMQIFGDGSIGQQLGQHYILSMHGSSISERERLSFGGSTFGIRNLFRLTMDAFYMAAQQLPCNGFRYGAVSYRRTALSLSRNTGGGAAIALGEHCLNPVDLDVLRKPPVEPFVQQDEWRIAIFVERYLNDDPAAPLRIRVLPSHFYSYIG